jgi:hypothetical protein
VGSSEWTSVVRDAEAVVLHRQTDRQTSELHKLPLRHSSSPSNFRTQSGDRSVPAVGRQPVRIEIREDSAVALVL